MRTERVHRWARRGLCGALLVLAAPRSGWTATAEERFEWTAPLACPDGERVLAAVAELTGPRPLDFAPFRSIQGRVERVGSEWQLSLELVDGSRRSSRRFRAPSCEELVRAAGVAIAIALDSAHDSSPPSAPSDSALAPEGVAAPAAAPMVEAARAATPAVDTTPEPLAVRTAPRVELTLEAHAIVDAAALPKPAPGIGVALGLRQVSWAALAYSFWLPTQSESKGTDGRVEFSLLAAGLRSCYRIEALPLRTSVCAGLELGRQSAEGIGLLQAASFDDWWLASGAGLDLSGELAGGWFWQARGDAVVPWFREKYLVNGSELVQRAPLLGFRAAVGLGVTLP